MERISNAVSLMALVTLLTFSFLKLRARVNKWLVSLFFLLIMPLVVLAQTPVKLPPETVQKIESLISKEMARQKIPGLSLAWVVKNQLVYAKGFGLADIEHKAPATAETVYRTASVAKPITATAVMQLAEQGKLDLDAPIQKYCPAFPKKNWPVTARLLLGHLGGVRHYKSGQEATGTKPYFTLVDSLGLFKDDALLHEPGTKYHYTTFGYSVLGCAVEGASGLSFAEYMQKQVWGPGGMLHTGMDSQFAIIPHRARGYLRLSEEAYKDLPEAARRSARVGEIYNAQLHDTSMKAPGGGLVSTAIDLAKFAIAINTGVLLKTETQAQMWTKQKTRDGKETPYGLGWGIAEVNQKKVVTHSGAQAGTRTHLILAPSEGFALALMTNLQETNLQAIIDRLKTLNLWGY